MKNSKNLDPPETKDPVEKWKLQWIDISEKKKYKWPITTWKDVQCLWPLEKGPVFVGYVYGSCHCLSSFVQSSPYSESTSLGSLTDLVLQSCFLPETATNMYLASQSDADFMVTLKGTCGGKKSESLWSLEWKPGHQVLCEIGKSCFFYYFKDNKAKQSKTKMIRTEQCKQHRNSKQENRKSTVATIIFLVFFEMVVHTFTCNKCKQNKIV